jgi:hypothetical protein
MRPRPTPDGPEPSRVSSRPAWRTPTARHGSWLRPKHRRSSCVAAPSRAERRLLVGLFGRAAFGSKLSVPWSPPQGDACMAPGAAPDAKPRTTRIGQRWVPLAGDQSAGSPVNPRPPRSEYPRQAMPITHPGRSLGEHACGGRERRWLVHRRGRRFVSPGEGTRLVAGCAGGSPIPPRAQANMTASLGRQRWAERGQLGRPPASPTGRDERGSRLGILGRRARCLPPRAGEAAQPPGPAGCR